MKEDFYNENYVVKGNILEKDFLFPDDVISVRFLELEDGVFSWVAQCYTKEIPAILMAKVAERFFNDQKKAKKLFLPRIKSDRYEEPYILRQKKLMDYYEQILKIIQV